jgi:DNA-binding XRE family transcriptional regulator
MARNFRELEAKMRPESRERARKKAEKMIREMPLDELRAARTMTQEQLAKILNTNQAAVSKLERRADMYLSTLRGFIRAMGGDLEIRAVFPDSGVIVITGFEELGSANRE